MRPRSRLLQSGKAAYARHPEGKSANAIKVCAMNAKHPPRPPMTLGNMRGGAAVPLRRKLMDA